MTTLTKLIAITIALVPVTAQAQNARVLYGPDGRVHSRTFTDSQGSTTFYGPDGRTLGRSSVDSQGTTTFYGADGHKTGTVIGGPPRRR